MTPNTKKRVVEKNQNLDNLSSMQRSAVYELSETSILTRAAFVVQLSIPIVAFILTYTELGYGVQVFDTLNDHYGTAVWIGGVASVALVVAYIFDIFVNMHKPTFQAKVKQVFAAALAVAFAVSFVLSVQEFHTAPACLTVVAEVGLTMFMKIYVYPNMSTGVFINIVGWSMGIIGSAVGIAWIAWIASDRDNLFDEKHRLRLEKELECEKLAEAEVYDQCSAAYLMWIWPAATAFMCGLFSAVCVYLSRTLILKDAVSAAQGLAKFMVAMCLIGVLSLWVAASIAAVKMGLADVVMQFSVLIVGLMLFLAYAALGSKAVRGVTQSVAIFRKFEEYGESDWVKAFMILLFLPQLAAYCSLSTINQAMRRCLAGSGWLASPDPSPEDLSAASPASDASAVQPTLDHSETLSHDPSPLKGQLDFLTVRCRMQIERLLVRPTSILVKAMWWAVIYFSLDVGAGKFVILFLSWFSEAIQSSHTAIVFVLFVAVGIFLFLLPPVPGPPVYLCAGVILVRKMEPDYGFWPAIFAAIASAFMVKLMACALQQKMIGENFADNLWVRKTLAVNSVTLRAIRYCIDQPGLSPAKVAILCGGPDWPTSVLCGVLRLPLIQIMIGTTPVLVLYIAESVLAAGFQLKKDEGAQWESMANVAIGITAVAMMLTMFSALYYIEDTIDKKRDYLMDENNFPIDLEVQEAEEKEAMMTLQRFNKTRWFLVPTWLRCVIVVGVVAMSVSCYAFAVFSDSCFYEFGVEMKISQLPGGNAHRIVKPLGYVAVGIFLFGCLCLHTFRMWANARVAEMSDDVDAQMREDREAATTPGFAGKTPVKTAKRRSVFDVGSFSPPEADEENEVFSPGA